jgi:hypothetical protein
VSDEQPIESNRGRAAAAYVCLAFAWCVIGGLIVCGSPDNSLHEAGLDWSYWLIVAILVSQSAALAADMVKAFLAARK